MDSTKTILSIRDLSIGILSASGTHNAVNKISYDVKEGEILGVVGESGCGKTVTNLAIMGLLPKTLYVEGGQILFEGQDLVPMSVKQRNLLTGKKIAMIYQEPLTSLNPLMKIGAQVAEPLKVHEDLPKEEIHRRVLQALTEVGLPDPEGMCKLYPHQLSGGQRQRVMIAMATVCRPDLMIADEPTTALDVTVQAQVLSLLKKISKKHGMAIIFISHDLSVIRQIADRVLVMYAGKIVEEAETETILQHPAHPYTKGLILSIPTRDSKGKDLPCIEGHVPSTTEKRFPCPFAPRCSLAQEICRKREPEKSVIGGDHVVYCHRKEEL